MSNRPSKRPSRSLAVGPHAQAANRSSSRPKFIALGVGIAVLLSLGASVAVTRSQSSEPTLDAQAAHGRDIAKTKCMSCHTSTGDISEGPTWKGLYGKPVALTDGSTVTADDAYLVRSIRDPRGQRVAGYGVMPTVSLIDDEVTAVVAYIKALA